ncbi:MAG: 16S rRNA (cytosine(1402)-N(4))-methyltransferase RsmH [Desulfobulbaceae bacterium]|uniref:Ribosomal RNA small subunit methyltransferase H n=1 Tax=Candidatus Desulfobia pelagia TaxID=2841692 RepID=A0A8J6NDQ5_9BACT|nr:16S rRNA (cytosine(1402)-N(4))-methyltransferase RsmH [Candidatus Desulfobia pelagia]
MNENGNEPAESGLARSDIHQPVLLEEVVSWLSPVSGGIYVDGNLGLGGHTRAILEASNPDGRVIGFDWDSEALSLARANLASYGERVIYVRRNFAELEEALKEIHYAMVDGILLDLGLSSLQLDSSGRGFSFQGSEPLDMRMDTRRGETAADLLNHCSEEELADILYYYGEERQARRIAEFIVEERRKEKFSTTRQLVSIIEKAVPRRFRPKKIHVATRTFQGLRIAVNGELDNLEKILTDGVQYIRPGGRFCVISFHSLEDRLVKRQFSSNNALRVLTPKPVIAGDAEKDMNPRSRSAKMRVAAVKEV